MRFVKWWVRFCERVLSFEYPATRADVTWRTFFKKLLTDGLIDTSILLIAAAAFYSYLGLDTIFVLELAWQLLALSVALELLLVGGAKAERAWKRKRDS